MKNIPNQDTLGAALDLVVVGVNAQKFPLKFGEESFRHDWAVSGGVPYGTHLTKTFELETGKPKARRFLSVTITRLDSGRYETVAYIS